MFPFFNSYSKYPFLNNQQLNLDWIMERVAHSVEVVELTALPSGTMTELQQLLDYNTLQVPVGFSVVMAGSETDPIGRRACCLVYKVDSDNMIVNAIAFSEDFGPVSLAVKWEGEWSV